MGTVLFASSTEAMIFAFLASILGALIGQLSVSLLLKCATAGSLSDSVSKGSKLARVAALILTYLPIIIVASFAWFVIQYSALAHDVRMLSNCIDDLEKNSCKDGYCHPKRKLDLNR